MTLVNPRAKESLYLFWPSVCGKSLALNACPGVPKALLEGVRLSVGSWEVIVFNDLTLAERARGSFEGVVRFGKDGKAGMPESMRESVDLYGLLELDVSVVRAATTASCRCLKRFEGLSSFCSSEF